MPYRLSPKNKRQVQVYKNGRWINKGKQRPTVKKAQAYLYRLNKATGH